MRFDGFIDVHAHADPDRTHRSLDVLELCKIYRDRVFRGVVIMNHYDSSAGYAYLARKAVPGLEVFSGIVLNHLVGGMNPHAIEHMTRIEGGYGRIVYMPTVNSEYDILNGENPNRPFVPISQGGRLLPEVLAAIDRVAELGIEFIYCSASPSRRGGPPHTMAECAGDARERSDTSRY